MGIGYSSVAHPIPAHRVRWREEERSEHQEAHSSLSVEFMQEGKEGGKHHQFMYLPTRTSLPYHWKSNSRFTAADDMDIDIDNRKHTTWWGVSIRLEYQWEAPVFIIRERVMMIDEKRKENRKLKRPLIHYIPLRPVTSRFFPRPSNHNL